MTEKTSMPTNFQIFEYWKDREIGSTWVLDDYGEPKCWGCGKMIVVETERDLLSGNYKAIWNRTSGKLQKCHIVAKSLGGSNNPENLFLLCEKCHQESPDTDSRHIFLTWILLQRSHCLLGFDLNLFMKTLEETSLINGVDVNDVFKFISQGSLYKLLDELTDRTTSHGGNYSNFNIPMLIVEAFINKRKEIA